VFESWRETEPISSLKNAPQFWAYPAFCSVATVDQP